MILAFGHHYPVIHAPVFIAPGSYVIGRAEIGEQSSVWFNAVVRADGDEVLVGKKTNLQDLVVVHADPGAPVVIGDQVTVGHGAIIHGATIASEVLIGMGAVVMNGAVVEGHAIVAAGTLVPESMRVPAGTLVMGRPARVMREVTEEEVRAILAQADSYLSRWVNEGWHFH